MQMRGNKKAICKYRLQSLVVMHCHCQVAPYLGRGTRTGRMQRGGKDPGANCISHLRLSAAFTLKSLTLSQPNCGTGAEAHFAGELRQRWEHAGAEKKTEATSHRRPHSCGGDAYGIPGIMVSADVESPPPAPQNAPFLHPGN